RARAGSGSPAGGRRRRSPRGSTALRRGSRRSWRGRRRRDLACGARADGRGRRDDGSRSARYPGDARLDTRSGGEARNRAWIETQSKGMASTLWPKVFLTGRVAVETDGAVIDEAQLGGRQGRL